MPRAAGLAAELERELALPAELIPGRNGVFDVRLDGQIVYSKWDTARFPEPGEVVTALRSRLPG